MNPFVASAAPVQYDTSSQPSTSFAPPSYTGYAQQPSQFAYGVASYPTTNPAYASTGFGGAAYQGTSSSTNFSGLDAAVYSAASQMLVERGITTNPTVPTGTITGYSGTLGKQKKGAASNAEAIARLEAMNPIQTVASTPAKARGPSMHRTGGPGSAGIQRWPKKNDKPRDPANAASYYCEVCKVSCAGATSYKTHLAGSKHKKREEMSKKLESVPPTVTTHDGRQAPTKTCELCGIIMAGDSAYDAHIKGKQHQRTLKLYMKMGKPIPEGEPTITQRTVPTATPGLKAGKPTMGSTICTKVVKGGNTVLITPKMNFVGGTVLTTTATGLAEVPANGESSKKEAEKEDGEIPEGPYVSDRPKRKESTPYHPGKNQPGVNTSFNDPIGQEYIQQTSQGKVAYYKCTLCNCEFSDESGMNSHIRGRKHRTNYKEKVDPTIEVEPQAAQKRKAEAVSRTARPPAPGKRPPPPGASPAKRMKGPGKPPGSRPPRPGAAPMRWGAPPPQQYPPYGQPAYGPPPTHDPYYPPPGPGYAYPYYPEPQPTYAEPYYPPEPQYSGYSGAPPPQDPNYAYPPQSYGQENVPPPHEGYPVDPMHQQQPAPVADQGFSTGQTPQALPFDQDVSFGGNEAPKTTPAKPAPKLDQKYLLMKHRSIIPDATALDGLEFTVNEVEKALKNVSEKFMLTDPNPNSGWSSEGLVEVAPDAPSSARTGMTRFLKGSYRFGRLTNNILTRHNIHGDVLLITNAHPTVGQLNTIAAALGRELSISAMADFKYNVTSEPEECRMVVRMLDTPTETNPSPMSYPVYVYVAFGGLRDQLAKIAAQQSEAAATTGRPEAAGNQPPVVSPTAAVEANAGSAGSGAGPKPPTTFFQALQQQQIQQQAGGQLNATGPAEQMFMMFQPGRDLDIQCSLNVLAQSRRTRWFQEFITFFPQCRMIMRILNHVFESREDLKDLSGWPVEFLTITVLRSQSALNSISPLDIPLSEAFWMILSTVSSGVFLPGCINGYKDPCERGNVDILGDVTVEKRISLTKAVAELVISWLSGDYASVLGVEMLPEDPLNIPVIPPPVSSQPTRSWQTLTQNPNSVAAPFVTASTQQNQVINQQAPVSVFTPPQQSFQFQPASASVQVPVAPQPTAAAFQFQPASPAVQVPVPPQPTAPVSVAQIPIPAPPVQSAPQPSPPQVPHINTAPVTPRPLGQTGFFASVLSPKPAPTPVESPVHSPEEPSSSLSDAFPVIDNGHASGATGAEKVDLITMPLPGITVFDFSSLKVTKEGSKAEKAGSGVSSGSKSAASEIKGSVSVIVNSSMSGVTGVSGTKSGLSLPEATVHTKAVEEKQEEAVPEQERVAMISGSSLLSEDSFKESDTKQGEASQPIRITIFNGVAAPTATEYVPDVSFETEVPKVLAAEGQPVSVGVKFVRRGDLVPPK